MPTRRLLPSTLPARADEFAALRSIEFEADRLFESVGIGPFTENAMETVRMEARNGKTEAPSDITQIRRHVSSADATDKGTGMRFSEPSPEEPASA